MIKLALIGAGGKMGFRISKRIKESKNYSATYVETAPEAIERLKSIGVDVTPLAEAVPDADMVVLGIPDRVIKTVGKEIVPLMRSGAILVSLDPAAAYAGVLPERKDIAYFVAHPCHPPLFNDETDPAAKKDWFGTVAKQNIVCAMFQGNDADYKKGEDLAKFMWSPVMNSYRITVEQMAILEPALVETYATAVIYSMKQMLDRTIEMGVPKEAAEAFFFGHARTSFGTMFGFADFQISDGAKLAAKMGADLIFQPGWMDKIMDIAEIKKSVKQITDSL